MRETESDTDQEFIEIEKEIDAARERLKESITDFTDAYLKWIDQRGVRHEALPFHDPFWSIKEIGIFMELRGIKRTLHGIINVEILARQNDIQAKADARRDEGVPVNE